MGQGTMRLSEAADLANLSVEDMGREAYEGRLNLHPLPRCPACWVPDGRPCQPTCEHAGTQIVWLGDWFAWCGSHAPKSENQGRPA